MPRRNVRLTGRDGAGFSAGMAAISAQLRVPGDFPPEVQAAAAAVAGHPRLPDLDRTDLPLVTIDPPGSLDLDQALHIERSGHGYRVWYAIADVAAFVAPDGAIDVEAHRRGETLYAPDHRVPLHPLVLSEGAASLLPGQLRPALVWRLDLDADGEGTRVEVARAQVRSRAKLDYGGVQRRIDEGTAEEPLMLLREVGRLRQQREQERGGVSLPVPEQEVVVEDGRWSLEYHTALPVEGWNAEISLLTGMGCAQIMLYGEVGILRTLPPADDRAIHRLRHVAKALRLHWDADVEYPEFVRSLDQDSPAGAAMLTACASLLRGAAYVAFDGGVPEHIEHAALAAEYAHCTAPLRRLVDRYAGEVAVALCSDQAVPDWVTSKLRSLPKEMAAADQRAHQFDAAVVSLVESGMLEARVGQEFDGVVIEADNADRSKGRVMVQEPAVEGRVESPDGDLPLGEEVVVRLVEADRATRAIRFELAEPAPAKVR